MRNMWLPCSHDWDEAKKQTAMVWARAAGPSQCARAIADTFAETYIPPCRCYSHLCTTFSIGARRTKFGTTVRIRNLAFWQINRTEWCC